MVAMSRPSRVIQACSDWPVSASGSPEAKPSSVTTSMRCARANWRASADPTGACGGGAEAGADTAGSDIAGF